MSTKIYSGIRFVNPDIVAVRDLLFKLQKKIQAKTTELIMKRHTNLIASAIDTGEYDLLRVFKSHVPEAVPRKKGESVYGWTAGLLSAAMYLDRSSPAKGMCLDYKFEVTIFPLKGMTLGMYFSGVRELQAILLTSKGIKDYHYQNQCDRDEKVSSREWRQRKLNWEEVFKDGRDAPSQAGFTMTLSEEYWDQMPCYGYDISGKLDRSKFMSFIPTFEERVKRVSETLTMRNNLKFTKPSEWVNYHNSEKYAKELEKAKVKARKSVKKEITVDDVWGK